MFLPDTNLTWGFLVWFGLVWLFSVFLFGLFFEIIIDYYSNSPSPFLPQNLPLYPFAFSFNFMATFSLVVTASVSITCPYKVCMFVYTADRLTLDSESCSFLGKTISDPSSFFQFPVDFCMGLRPRWLFSVQFSMFVGEIHVLLTFGQSRWWDVASDVSQRQSHKKLPDPLALIISPSYIFHKVPLVEGYFTDVSTGTRLYRPAFW